MAGRLKRAPRPQQRLLRHVLGVVRGAEHAVAVHLQRAAVGLDQRAERPLVAGLGGRHEGALVDAVRGDRGHVS
jgi:hypothetical protein